MSLQMHSALHSDDPNAIQTILKKSASHGEDVATERKSLELYYNDLLDHGNREMEGLLTSNDYEKVSAALRRYEDFPEETRR